MTQVGIASIQQYAFEQGAWAPVDMSGAGLVFIGAGGAYTRFGDFWYAIVYVLYPVTADISPAYISMMPWMQQGAGILKATDCNLNPLIVNIQNWGAGDDEADFRNHLNANYTNAQLSGKFIRFIATGRVA